MWAGGGSRGGGGRRTHLVAGMSERGGEEGTSRTGGGEGYFCIWDRVEGELSVEVFVFVLFFVCVFLPSKSLWGF